MPTFPGGRRVDANDNAYTCITPGRSLRFVFSVDHRTFGGLRAATTTPCGSPS